MPAKGNPLDTKDKVVLGLGGALIVGGLVLLLIKPGKKPGDEVTAEIAFDARGNAPMKFIVGFGIAPARILGHHDPIKEYFDEFELDLGPKKDTYTVTVKGILPEVITPGKDNKLDCRVFVQDITRTNLTNPVWLDDVILMRV